MKPIVCNSFGCVKISSSFYSLMIGIKLINFLIGIQQAKIPYLFKLFS